MEAVPFILPDGTAVHAVRFRPTGADDDIDVSATDLPDAVRRSVPKRIRAFRAGRHCASRALASLGASPGVIPIGPMGMPVWPSGIVGSITHSAGFAAAAVASQRQLAGLGIDCEAVMDEAACDELLDRVLPEAGTVARLGPASVGEKWPVFVTAAFSAKESVYKCLFPLVRVFFDFDAVRLETVDISTGELGLRVTQDLGGGVPPDLLLTARYRVKEDHVFTSVALAASDR